MPPKRKFRRARRKKRKFTGNVYTRKRKLNENESTVGSTEESEVSDTDCQWSCDAKIIHTGFCRAKVKTLPASVKKLEQDSGDSSESSSEDQSKTPEDFRFVDIAILRAIFVSFLCPLCRYGHIVFEEDQNSKKGFATLLVLKCASRKCKYSKSFWVIFL